MGQELEPFVSIGMPVWNSLHTIEQSVKSILAQKYSNFEMVISDNQCTDGTTEVLRRLASQDQRIRYQRLAIHVNATENFQTVLHRSKGNLFMWASSDDLWDDTWLERLVRACTSENALAFGGLRQIDPAGHEVPGHPAHGRQFRFSSKRSLRVLKFVFLESRKGKANLIYSLGYRADFLEATSELGSVRFNSYGGDMALVLLLLKRRSFVSVEGTNFYKRLPDDPSSSPGERVSAMWNPSQLLRRGRAYLATIRADYVFHQRTLRPLIGSPLSTILRPSFMPVAVYRALAGLVLTVVAPIRQAATPVRKNA